MYENYYNLKAMPFQITTDPRFLWLGEKHSEALATLKYGIMENKGFLLLTGDVGTGKTALINRLVKIIDVAAIVAKIPDPGLSSLDFFNFLAVEFKMKQKFDSKGQFLINLKHFLHKAYERNKSQGKNVGGTWKTLYKEYQKNGLVDFYRKQSVTAAQIEKGLRKDELVCDRRLSDYLEGLEALGLLAAPQQIDAAEAV